MSPSYLLLILSSSALGFQRSQRYKARGHANMSPARHSTRKHGHQRRHASVWGLRELSVSVTIFVSVWHSHMAAAQATTDLCCTVRPILCRFMMMSSHSLDMMVDILLNSRKPYRVYLVVSHRHIKHGYVTLVPNR